jgi:hypothetical protein
MNVYYELYDKDGPYYEAQYNVTGRVRPTRTLQNSVRVWCEYDGNNVKFIKHRHADPMTTIPDMDEFIFVKLSARVLYVGK